MAGLKSTKSNSFSLKPIGNRHIAKYLPFDHSKFLPGNDRMRLFMLCILVLSLAPLSSAVVDLSGQSGKDVLSSMESGSGLWNWGSAPFGHVLVGNELISGFQRNPKDISTMETPLQAQGMDRGSFIVPIIFGGFDDMSSLKSAPGGSTSVFKAPSEAQFPRIY